MIDRAKRELVYPNQIQPPLRKIKNQYIMQSL